MKFTKTNIENLEPGPHRKTFFDDDLKGFAIRVGTGGDKAFYLVYRAGKGRGAPLRWLRLGAFPSLTVEQARRMAKEKAATVTLGHDPAIEVKADKEAITMAAGLQIFQDEYLPKLKLNTLKSYQILIRVHLLPPLGKLRVKDVAFSNVAKLHQSMKDTPYAANRALAVLSKFFSWCEMHGYRQRESNPCRGVKKYKELLRQDFLGVREIVLIGETISKMEATWRARQETREKRPGSLVDTLTPQAATAIRLLLFTGARLNEILSLEWDRLDLEGGTAQLPDSKTGFKVIPLPGPALEILGNWPQTGRWVFPADSASGHMVNLKDAWHDVLKQAGLTGWRLHDLRHAFASIMVNSGASLPFVGKVLGHTQPKTTARYAHLEANPARQAAEAAAAKISEAMAQPYSVEAIPIPPPQAGAPGLEE